MENKKKISLIGVTGLCAALTISAICFGASGLKISKGDDAGFGIQLASGNGAVSVGSKKTAVLEAETKNGNGVTVYAKNMAPVSGKIGKINAKGFYANRSPLCGMSSIKVVSSAGAGDAVLKWGLSSECKGGSADLASAAAGVDVGDANYFRIEAVNEVVVESVDADFICSASSNGGSALDDSNAEVADAFKYVSVSDGWSYQRNNGTKINSVRKLVVPDFYGSGDEFNLVTQINDTGSTGLIENNNSINSMFVPATVKRYGKYLHYTSNQITTFTYGLEAESIGNNPIPQKAVELTIDSRHLESQSASIPSTLKTINVTANVEVLPNFFSSSLSSAVTINYEGTEAEWASLIAASSNTWKNCEAFVKCSDTVLCDVTLSFDGCTLGDDSNSKVISRKSGTSFENPGSPAYPDDAKKFDGWFTEAEGGEQVSFPFVVSGDVILYAQFSDWGAGSSVSEPLELNAIGSYSGAVSPSHIYHYMKFTAPSAGRYFFRRTGIDFSSSSSYKNSDYARVAVVDADDQIIKQVTGYTDENQDIFGTAKYGGGKEFVSADLAKDEAIIVRIAGSDYTGKVVTGSISMEITKANDKSLAVNADALTKDEEVAVEFVDRTNGERCYSFKADCDGYQIDYSMEGSSVYATFKVYSASSHSVVKTVNASSKSGNVKFDGLTINEDYILTVSTARKASDLSSMSFTLTDLEAGYLITNPIEDELEVGCEEVDIARLGKATTFYSLSVEETQTLRFTIAGGYVSSNDSYKKVVKLYSASNLTTPAYSIEIDAPKSETSAPISGDISNVAEGEYVVEIGYKGASVTADSASYQFQLSIDVLAPGAFKESAYPIALNSESGNLVTGSAKGTWYKFTPADIKVGYSFSFSDSNDANLMVDIVKADGTVLTTLSAANPLTESLEFENANYYFKAYGSTTSVTITYTNSALPKDGKNEARSIALVEGEVVDVLDFLPTDSSRNMYVTFTPSESGVYYFYSNSACTDFRTPTIYSADGSVTLNAVGSGLDDVGSNYLATYSQYCSYKYDFLVSITLEAGKTYYAYFQTPKKTDSMTFAGIGFSKVSE